MAYELDSVKLLIVDDMAPMLSLIKSTLKIMGFHEIYTARDGEEAFELVCKHDPDLILTDWVMDPIDGLEFTKNVRKDPMTPNPYVPIIMMTGFSSKLRVEMSRDHGITEFIVKPFNAKDLYARIFQIIEKPRQFVDAGDFFGPDRRRKRGDNYQGPRRRNVDASKNVDTQAKRQAIDILNKLREDAKKV